MKRVIWSLLPIVLIALIALYLFFVPSLYAQNAESSRDAAGPFAGSVAHFRSDPDSHALYYRNAAGEEITLVDNEGNVVYARPEDVPLDKLSPEAIEKTMTPMERSVLTPEPENSYEWVCAAVTVSRIGRVPFVNLLYDRAQPETLTDKEAAQLIDQVGPEKFYQFMLEPELSTDWQNAARKIQQMALSYWQSPDALEDAFHRALNGIDSEKVQALADLKKGGDSAILYMFELLSDSDEESVELAQEVLSDFGLSAREALLVELFTEDEDYLIRLASILKRTKGYQNIDLLIARYYDANLSEEARTALGDAIVAQQGSIPSPKDAALTAAMEGIRWFEGKNPVTPYKEGEARYWQWSASDACSEPILVSTKDFSLRTAADHLLAARRINPDDSNIASTAAFVLSESMVSEKGLDSDHILALEEYQDRLGAVDNEVYTQALVDAMKIGHPQGGIYPVLAMGASADATLVTGNTDSSFEPTPLVQAVTSSDRRLRFAALEAIGELNPPSSFLGSGSVINALLHFTSASGKRFALVGASRLENASLYGSLFADRSIRVIPVTSGGELIRLAQENADVEYVVAVSYLRTPDVQSVCQTLAADYRTSDIPVFVGIEDDSYYDQATVMAGTMKNAVALPLPSDREAGAWTLKELYDQTNLQPVPCQERLRQAKVAMGILTNLLKEGQTFCEPETIDQIVIDDLHRPEIREEGMTLALNFRSVKIQTALMNSVIDRRIPKSDRDLYFATLTEHIARYGNLLRGPELRQVQQCCIEREILPEEEQRLLEQLFQLVMK